jgi:hypothetical protein
VARRFARQSVHPYFAHARFHSLGTDDACGIGMSHLSTSLRSESEKYRKAARNININAMIRQYAPLAAIAFILIILLYWRFS